MYSTDHAVVYLVVVSRAVWHVQYVYPCPQTHSRLGIGLGMRLWHVAYMDSGTGNNNTQYIVSMCLLSCVGKCDLANPLPNAV